MDLFLQLVSIVNTVKVWNNYTITLVAKDCIWEITKIGTDLRNWYISGQLKFLEWVFGDKLTTIAHQFIANLALQHMYNVDIYNAQQLIPRGRWLKAWLALTVG